MSRAGYQREYHIAVLGSGGVGKSCLTMQFVQGVFVERYDPTIEDSYRKHIDVDTSSRIVAIDAIQGRHVVLEIMDTAGTEQFSQDMYMRIGQGFLLVFSITSASSLRELVELRDQIVRTKGDPNFPIVLVGNKSDLEEDRAVSRAKAFQLSQSWGNIPYYETSARRATNINEVFIDVCRQIIRKDLSRARPEERDRQHKRRRHKHSRRDDHDRGGGSRCTIL
ncbi:Ras-related protein Rap-1b [Pseudocercospora fuligena]|uniref:Ras-related protein Rap-1b n=1 Tax=Pseudocercospora fuligena TaxID=685502 RepID=A0A8H6VEK9_9PEZI|nr:Ras-related protein Rap-1b [Pseudocercospora fuligena]